jgi:hypothetical protein
MSNAFFEGSALKLGVHVDWVGVYKRLRELAPKCTSCNGALDSAFELPKFIRTVDGQRQVCPGCFYGELGEALLRDTPK